MAINLLNIKPHKVSRDLSGYITFIYGGYKTGKTTLAAQMNGALLLAFERGYNALPGVVAQDITSWAEMRSVYRELKKPEVKAVYKRLQQTPQMLRRSSVRNISASKMTLRISETSVMVRDGRSSRMNLMRSSAVLLSLATQFILLATTKKVRTIKVMLLISAQLFLMQPVKLLLA